MDFAKIVELFDRHAVSFLAVNQPVERKPDRPGALSGSVSARVRPGMRHFLRDPPDCRVHHDWLAEGTVSSEPVSTSEISPSADSSEKGGVQNTKQPHASSTRRS